MATIFKRQTSPFYYVAWIDANGKRHWRSTKCSDRAQAEKVSATFEKSIALALQGRLTPDKAREVLSSGMEDIYLTHNSEALPGATVCAWCDRWLEAKKLEVEDSSFTRYTYVLIPFMAFLGAKADRDISMVTSADIGRFRDQQARALSHNTANLSVKILRACFGAAVKQGIITSNPASAVDKLKQRGESQRRPFTLSEIRRVLDACREDEWKGMVLIGCYTGARLSDIAALTWRAIDLTKREVAFTAKKTGRRMLLPLAKPVVDFLTTHPAGDDPDAPLFPMLASKQVSQLSDGFREVLVDAGMAKARTHKKTEDSKGRNAARPVPELSFHSLRHSFVSILKNAGASEAVAMALAGHETRAVSANYTHMDRDTLRAAVDGMPNVTKTKKGH